MAGGCVVHMALMIPVAEPVVWVATLDSAERVRGVLCLCTPACNTTANHVTANRITAPPHPPAPVPLPPPIPAATTHGHRSYTEKQAGAPNSKCHISKVAALVDPAPST